MDQRDDEVDASSAGDGPPWTAGPVALPTLRTGSCRRLVVLTTHLHEDVAAAGGLIARLAQRSMHIDALAVTKFVAPFGSPAAPSRSSARTRSDQRLAYERLGADDVRCERLDLPAGKVDDHRLDVVAAVSEVLGYVEDPYGVWVLAPWRWEQGSDHAAVGEAAALACHAYGARLIEYAVAGWPARPAMDPSWEAGRLLVLSPWLQARKRHAMAATLMPGTPEQVTRYELYFTSAMGQHSAAQEQIAAD